MAKYQFTASETTDNARYALTLFTVDEVQGFWSQLEETLDTVPYTWRHWTKEFIYDSISDSRIQVWGLGVAPEATLITFTTINVLPMSRVLSVIWTAGSFEDGMLPVIDAALTNYAKINECSEIEIHGRSGWEAKLRRIGFKCVTRVWTRPVARLDLN